MTILKLIHFYMCVNSYFLEEYGVRKGRADGRTDGGTERQTDRQQSLKPYDYPFYKSTVFTELPPPTRDTRWTRAC